MVVGFDCQTVRCFLCFFGHAFEPGFDLAEDCLRCFGGDAHGGVRSVTLLASGTAGALA